MLLDFRMPYYGNTLNTKELKYGIKWWNRVISSSPFSHLPTNIYILIPDWKYSLSPAFQELHEN